MPCSVFLEKLLFDIVKLLENESTWHPWPLRLHLQSSMIKFVQFCSQIPVFPPEVVMLKILKYLLRSCNKMHDAPSPNAVMIMVLITYGSNFVPLPVLS